MKDTSKFNEDFIKTIMKEAIKDSSSMFVFNILKNHMNFTVVLTLKWIVLGNLFLLTVTRKEAFTSASFRDTLGRS